jgi:hypothetical protein
MDKLGRSYTLFVQTTDGSTLQIQLPFTVEFDITRNTLTSANICSIRIYNLSVNNRNKIRKNVNNYGDLRSIILQAGYQKNNPIIFSGNITQAWSVREGVNFITQIECFDGGFAFANAQYSKAFPADTPKVSIIEDMISSLPDVSVGTIGSYPGNITRGNSYSGSTTELLAQITGGGFFIDNGKGNALGNNECLEGEIPLINSASGLLGTPVLEQTILNFDMIFEPRIVVGQKIELESSTDQNFNGFYKIISVKHRGMISAGVCGDAITSVGLWYGTGLLETQQAGAEFLNVG